MIMLNTSDIKQRFNHIEQSVTQAEQACKSGAGVPKDLRDTIHKLGTETDRAKQVLQTQDEKRIRNVSMNWKWSAIRRATLVSVPAMSMTH